MLKKIFKLLILINLLFLNSSYANDNLETLIKKLKKTEIELENAFAKSMADDNGKLYKSFKEVTILNNMAIQAIQNGDIDIALASVDVSLKASKNINLKIPDKYYAKKKNETSNNSEFIDKELLELSKNMIGNKDYKTLKSLKVIDDTIALMNFKNEGAIKQVSKNLKESKELSKLSKDLKINYSFRGSGVAPKNSAQFMSALEDLGIKNIVSSIPGTTTTITRQMTAEDFLQNQKDREWAENLFGQLKAEDFAISKEFTLNQSDINNLAKEASDQAKGVSKEFDAQVVADQLDPSMFAIPEKFRLKESEEEEKSD
tara:strand:+ start:550 stop:1497 length:948 start_codon:yes stop_codon:yes gene_type:complete